MKKNGFILMILLLPFSIYSQRWEIGLTSGLSNYQGDLAPEVVLKESHLMEGIFIKKNLDQYFSYIIGLNQGYVSGNDQNFDYLKIRNLSFQSSITELSAQLEFNFFPFAIGVDSKRFTTYVLTGLSVFKFNPQTIYQGVVYDLQKLNTEGKSIKNGHSYSLIQLSFPVGGGFKYNLSKRFNLALYLSYRYCFTDYLDDVSTTYYDKTILAQHYGEISAILSDRSVDNIGFMGKQRGRSDLNDWYIFAGLSLSYIIKNPICFFRYN